MYHPRFDYALLSLFDIEQLSEPFTVKKMAEGLWYVFIKDEAELLGSVRYSVQTGCYVSYKVQFIPAERKDER